MGTLRSALFSMNLTDVKLTDQVSRHEIDGHNKLKDKFRQIGKT